MQDSYCKNSHNIILSFLAILMLSITSCGNPSHNKVIEFPKEEELTSVKVSTTTELFSAYSIAYYSGYYLFTQKDSTFFCITDSKFHKVCDIAPKGHGRDEWGAPLATGQFITQENNKYFYVLERPKHLLYLLPIKGDNKKELVVNLNKRKEMYDTRYIYQTGRHQFAGALDYGNCNFFIYNSLSSLYKELEQPMECHINKNHEIAQTLCTYNRSKKRFAITYFSFPLIVIRNENGNIIKSIQIGSDWPTYNNKKQKQGHVFFIDVCSNNNYIYALYDDPLDKLKESILVFDWDGKAVARYKIERAVAFTVNGDDNSFITINEDDSNGVLSKYCIPKNKK